MRVNHCDQLYAFKYNRKYQSNAYYRNYSLSYNKFNNKKKNKYKRLTNKPGPVIEHIEGPVKFT